MSRPPQIAQRQQLSPEQQALMDATRAAYVRLFRGQGDAQDGLVVARDIANMARLGLASPLICNVGVSMSEQAVRRAGMQELAHTILMQAQIDLLPAARQIMAGAEPTPRQTQAVSDGGVSNGEG